jgi:hypothetical protein
MTNRFQKIVLYGAALNVLLLFLFPPYDLLVMGRGAPMFDAFHPVFSVPANRVINGDILYLLTFGVLINAGLAWLLLAGPKSTPNAPRIEPQTVVIAFGIVNLAIVLLFPPMEAFAFAQRITVGTFDGFYFAFGDKSRRSIFVPLLYIEGLFVLANACAFWLAMSIAERSVPATTGGEPAIRGHDADLPVSATSQGVARTGVSKRGADRRQFNDPAFRGPERRRGGDRRRPIAH